MAGAVQPEQGRYRGGLRAARLRVPALSWPGGTAPLASLNDVYTLAYWAQAAFDYMAVNFPYTSSYILNDQGFLPAFPMTVACRAMANATAAFRADTGALLAGLRDAFRLLQLLHWAHGAAGRRASISIAGLTTRPPRWTSWNFQYCSEVFQVASRDGVRDMFFDQPWNANASALGCARNAAYGGVVPPPALADHISGRKTPHRGVQHRVFQRKARSMGATGCFACQWHEPATHRNWSRLFGCWPRPRIGRTTD